MPLLKQFYLNYRLGIWLVLLSTVPLDVIMLGIWHIPPAKDPGFYILGPLAVLLAPVLWISFGIVAGKAYPPKIVSTAVFALIGYLSAGAFLLLIFAIANGEEYVKNCGTDCLLRVAVVKYTLSLLVGLGIVSTLIIFLAGSVTGFFKRPKTNHNGVTSHAQYPRPKPRS